MSRSARFIDVCLALILLILLAIPTLLTALLILCLDGRPVFFVSPRMKSVDRSFMLWKFRTMTQDSEDQSVSGGHKSDRITRLGGVLRRCRMDEIPQLFNILKGDMRFVGPRPPLPRYVHLCPDIYAQVLHTPPGITGMATLSFHSEEERLLQECKTVCETDAVYLSRCVPAKAKLDLFWARHRSIWLDVALLMHTILHVVLRAFRPRFLRKFGFT